VIRKNHKEVFVFVTSGCSGDMQRSKRLNGLSSSTEWKAHLEDKYTSNRLDQEF